DLSATTKWRNSRYLESCSLPRTSQHTCNLKRWHLPSPLVDPLPMSSSVVLHHAFRGARRAMSRKSQSLVALLCLVTFAVAQPARRQGYQSSPASEGSAPAAAALHVKIEGGSIRLEGYSGDRISYLVRSISPTSPDRSKPDLPQYKVASYVRGS